VMILLFNELTGTIILNVRVCQQTFYRCVPVLSVFVCYLIFKAVAMKRQNKSVVPVPDSKENIPFVNSSNQTVDKMTNVLDSTAAIDSDEFVNCEAFGGNLPENMLEPKLDTIFADVSSKLPSIDFDMSDVSCMLHTINLYFLW